VDLAKDNFVQNVIWKNMKEAVMSKKLISYKIICISGNATIVSLSLKEPKVATT